MRLAELYQQHYFYEVERRDKLHNSLSIPLGVISIISGALVVVAKEIDAPFDAVEWFQITFIVLTSISIVLTAIFIAKSYKGYGYSYAPKVGELKKHYDDLVVYYVSTGKMQDEANQISEKETLDFIDSEYAISADINTNNNDRKSGFIAKVNGFTIFSLVMLVVAAAPYVINTMIQPSEVQKFELINLKDLNLSQPTTPPASQNQQQPTAPIKPTAPTRRVIQESRDPITKK